MGSTDPACRCDHFLSFSFSFSLSLSFFLEEVGVRAPLAGMVGGIGSVSRLVGRIKFLADAACLGFEGTFGAVAVFEEDDGDGEFALEASTIDDASTSVMARSSFEFESFVDDE